MVAIAYGVAFAGIEARLVEVQAAVAPGLPAFTVVGLPDKAVSEARERIRAAFAAEFTRLWREERRGIVHEASLYEDQGHGLASETARIRCMDRIRRQAIGVIGVELHRRILGLAHNADFEAIADQGLRAACEARALRLGRLCAVERGCVTLADAVEMARVLNGQDCL